VGRVEEAALEICEERRLQRGVPGHCGPDSGKDDRDRGRTSRLSRALSVCSSAKFLSCVSIDVGNDAFVSKEGCTPQTSGRTFSRSPLNRLMDSHFLPYL
jgi:hypothetical protein